VVTTKWDLILLPDALKFVSESEQAIKAQAGTAFSSISFHRIAARPTSDSFAYAYGVPELLSEWTSSSPERFPIVKPALIQSPGLSNFAQAVWAREGEFLSEAMNVI
jgi:hypothetical protein